MSNEHLRQDNMIDPKDTFWQVFLKSGDERKSLIISAYMDEHNRWKEKRIKLFELFQQKISELNEAYVVAEQEPKWKKVLFHKVLRRETPGEQGINKAADVMEQVSLQINNHNENEPDASIYQLATIGTNLFKSR